jgi:hypothetical protein
MRPFAPLFALLLLFAGPFAAAEEAPPLLRSGAFQSFVANWSPANRPLCAALRSQADWDKIFKPAAVIGTHPPFAPPPEFWTGSALLVLAQVVPGGSPVDILQVDAVQRHGTRVEVAVTVPQTPPASWQSKTWVGITLAPPLPTRIRFREAGKIVCTLEPAARHWVEPRARGE